MIPYCGCFEQWHCPRGQECEAARRTLFIYYGDYAEEFGPEHEAFHRKWQEEVDQIARERASKNRKAFFEK